MTEPSGISYRDVRKAYGDNEVLSGLSLDVPPGQFLVLLGPSGCGKTTLLRLTAGLIFPDAGEIEIGDRAVQDLPPKGRDAAMVFQSYALYPHLTVGENLGFPLQAAKRPPREIADRVASVAERLSIDQLLGQRPDQLSGGQAQRVALGRAIVREPSVFLMDEPLSNLDAKLRVQLRVELKRLHQQLGITTIYVTHDQEEALTLGDSIAVMSHGHVEQRGTPEEIYHEPATLFVAKFVGSPEINTFAGSIEGEGADLWLRASGLELPIRRTRGDAPRTGEVTVAIRPESVRLGPAEQYAVAGVVDVVEMVGRELRVYVETDVGTMIATTPVSEKRHVPGERVSLTFSDDGHHYYDVEGNLIRSIRPIKQEALHA